MLKEHAVVLKVFAVNACFACAFHANSHYLNIPH
jgi:hypothetical protein